MPEIRRAAALVLQAGLWGGVALVAVATLLQVFGGSFDRWTRVAATLGIGVVLGAPFLTLVAIALVTRRPSTAAYAVVTLAVAVVGILLAR
jgi:hypothetical protein